jgi:hypothetical protein
VVTTHPIHLDLPWHEQPPTTPPEGAEATADEPLLVAMFFMLVEKKPKLVAWAS